MGVPFCNAGHAIGRSALDTAADTKAAMARRAGAALILVVVCASCGTVRTPAARSKPFGPPRLADELVRRHARQFDVKLPNRPAGSQNEQIAATYILAHLERAGYVVFLDP